MEIRTGDIVAIAGVVVKTETGRLSIEVPGSVTEGKSVKVSPSGVMLLQRAVKDGDKVTYRGKVGTVRSFTGGLYSFLYEGSSEDDHTAYAIVRPEDIEHANRDGVVRYLPASEVAAAKAAGALSAEGERRSQEFLDLDQNSGPGSSAESSASGADNETTEALLLHQSEVSLNAFTAAVPFAAYQEEDRAPQSGSLADKLSSADDVETSSLELSDTSRAGETADAKDPSTSTADDHQAPGDDADDLSLSEHQMATAPRVETEAYDDDERVSDANASSQPGNDEQVAPQGRSETEDLNDSEHGAGADAGVQAPIIQEDGVVDAVPDANGMAPAEGGDTDAPGHGADDERGEGGSDNSLVADEVEEVDQAPESVSEPFDPEKARRLESIRENVLNSLHENEDDTASDPQTAPEPDPAPVRGAFANVNSLFQQGS